MSSLADIDINIVRDIKVDDEMNNAGRTEFRSAVAKLATVAYASRPDLCFIVKILSEKYGKAKKSNLKTVQNKILVLKGDPNTSMMYPNLGKLED